MKKILIFILLATSTNLISAQVPHGNITIEVPLSHKFEVFPDFGSVIYLPAKEVYTFKHYTDKHLIQTDTLVDSLMNKTVRYADGWVNFDFQRNRLYSSMIVQKGDSMLVYVFTGRGSSDVDRLLRNNSITFTSILYKNLVFNKGTALINIFEEDLKTFNKVFVSGELPENETLIIQGDLINDNLISEELLTTKKLEEILAKDDRLPEECKVIFDCFGH